MTTFRFTLAFRGVDPWDDDQIEALAKRLPRVHWGTVNGEVHATAFADATTGMRAVLETVDAIKAVVAAARPLYVIEDFVSVSDIAQRTGMNRETVRLWSLGERGPGGFPRSRGTVGKGIRIWDWASVSSWLRRHYELGDAESHLSASEIARLNDIFAVESRSSSSETVVRRVAVSPSRRGCWSGGKQARISDVTIPGDVVPA